MKQVGIVSSVYHNYNYGGMLQGYALCRKIRELGYTDAEHVCRSPGSEGTSINDRLWGFMGKTGFRRRIREDLYRVLIARQPLNAKDIKRFREFEREEIPEGTYSGDVATLPELNQKYRCFVAGSDQIWNPGYFGEVGLKLFGLTFADPDKRTVSYAASIGSEKAAETRKELFREILKGLDYISVREYAARDFLQPLTDKPVTVVADPTMLFTGEDWEKVARKPAGDRAYAFAYFLRESTNPHNEQVQYILERMGLPMMCIAAEPERYLRKDGADRKVADAGPREFVGYIQRSELVMTNSFHGTVFSLLFHKPFWAFKRNKDSETGNMNARITDLLRECGLSDRLLEDGELPSLEKLRQPIDYDRVDRILEEKRAFSLNWLKTALEGV